MQWSDKAAYNDTLLKLGGLFKKNFEVFASYKIGTDNKLTEEILAAGPNFWLEWSLWLMEEGERESYMHVFIGLFMPRMSVMRVFK